MHPNNFLYDKLKYINKSCKSIGKTKVKFVESKIYEPNIYHVHLEFESNNSKFLSEIGKNQNFLHVKEEEVNYYNLPNIDKTLTELKDLQDVHNKQYYIFGINDCRHFCDRMLESIYDITNTEYI